MGCGNDMTIFSRAWEEFLLPMLRRPCSRQVAALCWRVKDGRREVLLITSRDAWEEAGVKAQIDASPLGSYAYDKGLDGGLDLPTRVDVYGARVTELAADWPERAERTREWVRPDIAATRVDEPELRDLLLTFAKG